METWMWIVIIGYSIIGTMIGTLVFFVGIFNGERHIVLTSTLTMLFWPIILIFAFCIIPIIDYFNNGKYVNKDK